MRLETTGAVGVLSLDRPEKLNALRGEDFAELRDVLREVAARPDVRVLVLAGRGRAFCAGLDLGSGFGDPAPGSIQKTYAELRTGAEAITMLRDIPQPVVAAVQGAAIGAGFSLACAADIRVAAPDASFGAPFTRLGMTPGDLGLSWFLPRLMNPSATAELFYLGGALSGVRAAELGLVSRLDDDPLAAATSLAAEIAERSPLGVRQSKELLNASLLVGGYRQHLEIELRSQVLCAMTGDHQEAKAAFAERRPPVFTDQ